MIAFIVHPSEVICASGVINWTAGNLVSKTGDRPSRYKGCSMNDSWRVSSNSRKPFLCFRVVVKNILGGSLDADRDSPGDLEYREEHSET